KTINVGLQPQSRIAHYTMIQQWEPWLGHGSAVGGTAGERVGEVEQSGGAQAFPPLPAPTDHAGSPAARASSLRPPGEQGKNPKEV
ncbi:hypothetical protein O3P69_012710, partial [Scylla paramamosain]